MSRWNRVWLSLLVSFGMMTTSFAARPFIVDTDMGTDDAIALLYLLQRPDIEIKAVTIASGGNAHCEPALKNTLGLLKLVDKSNIPVACGPDEAMIGQHHYPASVMAASDTLTGTKNLLPQVASPISHEGIDLFIKAAKESKEPVTILALGPLTNLALALHKAPEIKKNIQTIYVMGGALHVPGNIHGVDPTINNLVAEWNIYLDPMAAHIVFNQNLPIVLISLDVTNTTPIELNFYERLKKDHHSKAADYVFNLLHKNLNALNAKEWFFWDPLAAVIASDESIATFKNENIKVVLIPEEKSGATIVDNRIGQKIRMVTAVDKNKFEALLLEYLNKK